MYGNSFINTNGNNSGVLIPKSKWNPYKEVYGPIVLENVDNYHGDSEKSHGFTNILTEAAITFPSLATVKRGLSLDNQRKVDDVARQVNQLNRLDSDLQRNEDKMQRPASSTAHPDARHSRDRSGSVTGSVMNPDLNRQFVVSFSNNLMQYRSLASRYVVTGNQVIRDINDIQDPAGNIPALLITVRDAIESNISHVQNAVSTYTSMYDGVVKDFREMEKYGREDQKAMYTAQDREIEAAERARQQKERDAESYRSHGGSWKMSEVHGIGFEATMATVEVRVQYVGGDYDSRKVYNSDARVNMPVGVKLIPNIVPGDSIRYALLSDAFRSKNDQRVTTYGRYAARQLIRFGEKFVKWVTGKDVDLARKISDDEVERQVLYAPQHLINASGFKRRPGSSDFYQFTSGVVILNKEELREIDDLLNDRNFMNRIIRLGWNSICVMDDVGEEALFISTVDGGYIHRLPYAYIFSAIGMTTTYDNIDKLQKHSGPFNRSDGRGFTPFGQKIMRESFSEMFDRIDNERDKSSRRSVPVSLDSDSYYG